VKILHVVPTYVPAWKHGGPIRSVHGLCKALAERGHEVTVFTTDVDTGGAVPVGEPVSLDGVEVWYFPLRAPRRLYRSPAMGRALAERMRGFDLVHLHSVFLWPTAAAARAAERAGVPYLLAPRGMLVRDLFRRRGRWRKALWLRLIERRTLTRAAGLHATSELEAAELAWLGSPGSPIPPVHVVPNGVDPEPPPNGAGLSAPVREALDRAPFLLFLGRLSWKKGLDRLIPALSRAPGAVLAVAGNDDEGYRPELERLAREAGVAGRVLFLGSGNAGGVGGADKAALLHGAAALVLPSYSENFGNSVLEAMAVGRPVVVTPEVGLASILRETGAGLVVEGDPERLGGALRDLLADPAAADAMGRRGAEAARERFGWGTVAAGMESAYRRVLAGRPR
jgi:glycosyltransferase involved in cell wall biosynthesis